MEKEYDNWNKLKKDLSTKKSSVFFHEREIWFCSLGKNIGYEEDGKNELFERPVLILKVFNKDIIQVAPLTSKNKSDKNHIEINYQERNGSVILSQIKTISTKRLSRKLCRITKKQFEKVLDEFRKSI